MKIIHASISENGTVNGVPGDQTGKEVCVRDWWDDGWNVVIRLREQKMRERLVISMRSAANNILIGYGQKNRNEILTEGRKVGYRLDLINRPVNCDCSSLVSVALMYAGIFEGSLYTLGNCCTTRNLRQSLKSTGEVEIITTPEYLRKPDKLLSGDILLAEGKHVAVVDGNDEKISPQLISDVLAGVYGNGEERVAKLSKLGYNYEEVRKKTNEVITQAQKLYQIKQALGEYWTITLNQVK